MNLEKFLQVWKFRMLTIPFMVPAFCIVFLKECCSGELVKMQIYGPSCRGPGGGAQVSAFHQASLIIRLWLPWLSPSLKIPYTCEVAVFIYLLLSLALPSSFILRFAVLKCAFIIIVWHFEAINLDLTGSIILSLLGWLRINTSLSFFLFFFLIFIVIQLQLYAFSPYPSTPPQVNPPPSPLSTRPLGFVHVSFR